MLIVVKPHPSEYMFTSNRDYMMRDHLNMCYVLVEVYVKLKWSPIGIHVCNVQRRMKNIWLAWPALGACLACAMPGCWGGGAGTRPGI